MKEPTNFGTWGLKREAVRNHTSRLPVEVYERVIDLLWCDPPTLGTCSLTCSSWLPRSRFWLFRASIRHLYGKNHYNDVLEELRTFPAIAPYVRILAVSRSTSDRRPLWTNLIPIHLAPILSRLYTLSFDITLSPVWMHPHAHAHLAFFRSVGNLSLDGCKFTNFNSFARLLLCFPALEYLTMRNPQWGKSTHLQHLIGKSRSRKLRIRSFALTPGPWQDMGTGDELMKWLITTPSATTITLFAFTSSSFSHYTAFEEFFRATSQNLKCLEIDFTVWSFQSVSSQISAYLQIWLCKSLEKIRFLNTGVGDIPVLSVVFSQPPSNIDEIWVQVQCETQEQLEEADWESFDACFVKSKFPNLNKFNLSLHFDYPRRWKGEKPDVTKVHSRLQNLCSEGLLHDFDTVRPWRDGF